MKPLHELLKGKVVNCQTEEEAKEFLSFMHENGYKWIDGTSLIKMTCFIHGRLACYNTNNVNNKISHSGEAYYKNKGYEVITYQQFKQLIKENNMETKEFKIQVPEGYEIDKENSTFDGIKFNPIKKVVNYEDVAKELFKDNPFYYRFGTLGEIQKVPNLSNGAEIYHCMYEKQAKKLLSINKLMNVAKYLNGEWCPNWRDGNERKWTLGIGIQNKIGVNFWCDYVASFVYFKSKEAAKQAIEILGEETIKLALSTDW